MTFANRYYMIKPRTQIMSCCNEIMFQYRCRNCYKDMGCYYCDFTYTEAHKCDE